MVLESLITVKNAEKKPLRMIMLGMLYATVAVFLALWIFKEQASLVAVFLTVLASVPIMYNIITFEEKEDIELKNEAKMLRSHERALLAFFYLFMGFVIAFSVWFILLPTSFVQQLFSTQIMTINSINAKAITAQATSLKLTLDIIINNLKVLFFCIFFSFFFGAGAIFILTWNASVIAAAVGNFIRSNIVKYAANSGLIKVAAYFHAFTIALLRYMTHGTFEILAYFVGGLAGGLISVALIKHEPGDKMFNKVLIDASYLVMISIVLVLIAGLIEVYITPLMF